MIAQWSNSSAVALFCAVAAAAGAQTYFDLWFQAPESVPAGDTFTVEVWAEASGDWVGAGDFTSFFHALLMTVEIQGDLSAFRSISEATIFTNYAYSPGTVAGNRLEDVVAINMPFFGVTHDNPLAFVSFSVATVENEAGVLILNALESDFGPDLLRWYVDFNGPDYAYIGSADDNSVLTANPLTVRVIPAPGSLMLVPFVGLAMSRRRR